MGIERSTSSRGGRIQNDLVHELGWALGRVQRPGGWNGPKCRVRRETGTDAEEGRVTQSLLFFAVHTRLGSPQASGNSPASDSHLSIRAQQVQMLCVGAEDPNRGPHVCVANPGPGFVLLCLTFFYLNILYVF